MNGIVPECSARFEHVNDAGTYLYLVTIQKLGSAWYLRQSLLKLLFGCIKGKFSATLSRINTKEELLRNLRRVKRHCHYQHAIDATNDNNVHSPPQPSTDNPLAPNTSPPWPPPLLSI